MDMRAVLVMSALVIVPVIFVIAITWRPKKEWERDGTRDWPGPAVGQPVPESAVLNAGSTNARGRSSASVLGSVPDHLISEDAALLMHWSATGDETRVRESLDGGADIGAVDAAGDGVLRYAMGSRNFSVFELLLNRGAGASAPSTSASGTPGFTILHAIAEYGWSDGIAALLRRGAEINARGVGGTTALMLAAGAGNDEVVAELHNFGADLDLVDDDGDGALMYAASRGHAATVERLASFGADVDPPPNKSGVNPLVVAAQLAGPAIRRPPGKTADDYANVVIQLLLAGADPAMMYDAGYALQRLDADGVMEIPPTEGVRRLVARGHLAGDGGWSIVYLTASARERLATPVDSAETSDGMRTRLAREYASLDSAREAQGAYNSRSLIGEFHSQFGQWGLHAAESAAEVRSLLRDGAPIDGVALIDYGDTLQHWETPLLTALVDGRSEAADELLLSGADVDAPNAAVFPSGHGFAHTALHMMIQRRDHGAVRRLIAAGANVNHQTTLGSTPLYFAASVDDLELVRILLDAGARPRTPDVEGALPVDSAGPRTRHLFA